MKKFIIWILILLSLIVLLLRFSPKAAEIFLGIKQESGISVLSNPTDATVYLDDQEVGKTPYENKNLEIKDYIVKLEKEEARWQGKVRLTAGTVTIINRDLVKERSQSAGEILTLDRGHGITVISNPGDARVEIDGKSYGNTPITIDIANGEHTILISHINYLKRSIRVSLPDNFNLTISVDLSLSEADLTTISTPVTKETLEVKVLQTPTGFLRVRDKPSLNGKEIAQVKPGDKLILLEELGDWDRVRLSDHSEGYVSATYVEKINP